MFSLVQRPLPVLQHQYCECVSVSFCLLELRGGAPVLSINHGSGTLTLQLGAAPDLTDHRWHRLDITSDGKVKVGRAREER